MTDCGILIGLLVKVGKASVNINQNNWIGFTAIAQKS